jgi:hypothetical protein
LIRLKAIALLLFFAGSISGVQCSIEFCHGQFKSVSIGVADDCCTDCCEDEDQEGEDCCNNAAISAEQLVAAGLKAETTDHTVSISSFAILERSFKIHTPVESNFSYFNGVVDSSPPIYIFLQVFRC